MRSLRSAIAIHERVVGFRLRMGNERKRSLLDTASLVSGPRGSRRRGLGSVGGVGTGWSGGMGSWISTVRPVTRTSSMTRPSNLVRVPAESGRHLNPRPKSERDGMCAKRGGPACRRREISASERLWVGGSPWI